jgi:hypothetical protein
LTHDTLRNEGDRRKTGQRFRISAAARFHWLGPDGVRRESTGTTRDISSNGIFIHADSFPLPGDAVEVIVSLPPLRRGGSGAQLYGKGVAIRLEGEDRSLEAFAAEVVFRVAPRTPPFDPDDIRSVH